MEHALHRPHLLLAPIGETRQGFSAALLRLWASS